MTELYKLLNVPRHATVSEIKVAYRVLALELHPDVNKGNAGKTARFRDIASAYEILSDESKRKTYDRTLGTSTYRNPVTSDRRSPFTYAPPGSSNSAADRAREAAAQEKYRRDFEASGGRIKFNVEEWHAWHYGDQAIIDALKMRSLRMGLGDDKEYVARTRRQMKAEEERRKKAFTAAEEEAEAVLQQMKKAREKLARSREERRKPKKEESNEGSCSMS